MHHFSLRLSTVAAIVSLSAVSAHAGLTLPTNFLVANSVQEFTSDNLDSFATVSLSISARGTASAVKAGPYDTPAAFSFPITKVVIGSKLNIESGSAMGAALFFNRFNEDTGAVLGLTLANFTIDYNKKQVLADTTPKGGTTIKMMPLYDFTVKQALAMKYSFPLTITLHEQLGDLKLTAKAKEVMNTVLELPDVAQDALNFNFGTLTQDVTTKLRSKAVSTTPYAAK